MNLHVALLLAYPLSVHFAVITQSPGLQLASLVVLALGLCYPGLKQNSLFAWAVLLAVCLLALAFDYLQLTMYVLYLPPVILPLLFWSVFYRSLMAGQTPLVTQIGERARGPFTEELKTYTRHVTQLWAVFLFTLALWSALLPWLASVELWSLFTNFLNYFMLGLLFVMEYIYRKSRFRDHDHPDFRQYLAIVFKANIRKL